MTSAVRPLASESGTGQQARFFYSPVWMVLVGLAARLLCIVIGHTYRFSTAYWSHWEMANLGYSLAMGHGFSAPFGGDTGPSAWTAPLYPWLISLAFRIFGVFSPGAAFAMLTFNSVFAALTSLDDLSHRASGIWGKGGRLVRMGLGVAALQHLLVRELGVGDQLVGLPVEPVVYAHPRDGR